MAVVDARTLRERSRFALKPEIHYRALVVEAGAGRLYVFGNRPGRVVDTVNRLREEAAVATSVDLSSGTRSTVTVREADERSWFVYWGALSADGKRLVVSYHGGCNPEYVQRCTGGADWLDIAGEGLVRCPAQAYPSTGCNGQVHGMVEPYGDGFLAARGLPAVAVLDRDLRELRRVNTRLRTHLMDFAHDDEVLYALGDCGKGTGLRAVPIDGGASRRLGPPSLCGERIAVARRALVVANTGRLKPRAVTVVELATGRVIRRLGLRSAPLDVVAG